MNCEENGFRLRVPSRELLRWLAANADADLCRQRTLSLQHHGCNSTTEELPVWLAVLNDNIKKLPADTDSQDPIRQPLIGVLEELYSWLTKTFQGAEKIEDNPAYRGMMNEGEEK